MHRARHAGGSSKLRRSRMLILFAVAGVGLAVALWLPTRIDTASASENVLSLQQAQEQRGTGQHWWYGRVAWHRQHRPNLPAWPPSTWPSAVPPTFDPPTFDPPTFGPPTFDPPTFDPPTFDPPTTAPPKVTAWAPYTDYTAGQLVSFLGIKYQVRETHTSLPGWEPPKLPELFKVLVD